MTRTQQQPASPGAPEAHRLNMRLTDTATMVVAALRIGELAKLTGVSVEAIRYYEVRGLVTRSSRRASGYREFAPDAVSQIRFIGRAQSLGFSLAEVKELVTLRSQAWAGDATAQLREAAVAKLRGIDGRLRELRELRNELASLVAACDEACPVGPAATAKAMPNGSGPPPATCPLVEALDSDDASTVVARPSSTHDTRSVKDGPPEPGRRTRPRPRVPAQATQTQRRNK